MTDSLRDQLLKAGFKPAQKARPERKGPRKAPPGDRKRGKKPAGKPRRGNGGGDISLAAAYAAKARDERRADDLRKAEKMRLDAERKRQNDELQALLDGRTLNDPEADIPRHFQDGERITRIYVTGEQQQALAEGRLGIIKLRRRYLLAERDLVDRAASIKADAVIDLSGETEG